MTSNAWDNMPALWSIGVATPPLIPQERTAQLGEERSCDTDAHRAFLRRVYSRSNVTTRGSVLSEPTDPDGTAGVRAFYPLRTSPIDRGPTTAVRMTRYALEAPPLAARAATDALLDAGVPAERITHLISVSCTGFCAPGLDVELICRLGLRPTVARLHVGFMGCHAALNALAAARAIALADGDAVVLVCSVELCSLHFAYGWGADRVVSNALFADGAAATIVSCRSVGQRPPLWRLGAAASLLVPDSLDAMTWRIGDHGFEMSLSARVPELIATHLRRWCQEWLGTVDQPLAGVGHWAVHPGGPRILTAVESALGLSPESLKHSRGVLDRFGNMSSATILFILRQMALDNARGSCVATGFGPGLMMEGQLLHR